MGENKNNVRIFEDENSENSKYTEPEVDFWGILIKKLVYPN